jgi:hypothetical protein
MLLTVGGSKTVLPRISGAWAAGTDEAGAVSTLAGWAAAEVSACGAGALLLTGFLSSWGAVQPATKRSAPMTTAVRRKGNKCLLDIEISVQISETA